jgi:hypothetical protein
MSCCWHLSREELAGTARRIGPASASPSHRLPFREWSPGSGRFRRQFVCLAISLLILAGSRFGNFHGSGLFSGLQTAGDVVPAACLIRIDLDG